MSWRSRIRRFSPWLGLLLAVGLIAVAFQLAWPRGRRGSRLSITAGDPSGARARVAALLAEHTRVVDIELTLTPSAGSRDALERVEQRELDLALVQGGLVAADYRHVRRVAVLQVEPLHLLVRSELYDDVSQHLQALRGKRINLGAEGSGTSELAAELLSFLDLNPETDYQLSRLSYNELLSVDLSESPDAVFSVSTLPSPVAQHLIEHGGYRLIPLPFARSFQLHWLDGDARGSVDRRGVAAAQIPAFVYGVDPSRPESDLATFGTRLQLVSHDGVPDATIDAICEAVYASDFGRVLGSDATLDMLLSDSSLPLHPGAQQYVSRRRPVMTGELIEVTEQLVAISGAALGGLLFLLQWWRQLRERRKDREFVECVQRVVEIETAALRFDERSEVTVDDLDRMQDELSRIKLNLLARYRDGSLEGADMLSAFLKHANDASELISQIVLHERSPRPSSDRAGSRPNTSSSQ